MKKLTLTIAAVITASLIFGQRLQDKDVPANIKTAFQKLYPTTKEVKWDNEEGNFEASFELSEVEYSVLFDVQGKLIETEVEIELNQLPSGVLDYIKTTYKGRSVKEAAKITDGRASVSYEAEIKGMDLLFDSNGKFIKEIKN